MRVYLHNGKVIIDNCLPLNELSIQTAKLLINSLKILVDKAEGSVEDVDFQYEVICLPDHSYQELPVTEHLDSRD
jgi:hypothetical protein